MKVGQFVTPDPITSNPPVNAKSQAQGRALYRESVKCSGKLILAQFYHMEQATDANLEKESRSRRKIRIVLENYIHLKGTTKAKCPE